MRAFLAALLLVAVPVKTEAPLKRVDRTKAVGAPVLDDETAEGIYVWLEDGWFNVAAVAREKKSRRAMSVNFKSTKKIEAIEGSFRAQPRANTVSLSATVGEVPVKSRFKTEGEVTVNTTHPLYVGPLSHRAARTLSIGRY